jgi:hypothetical protein
MEKYIGGTLKERQGLRATKARWNGTWGSNEADKVLAGYF